MQKLFVAGAAAALLASMPAVAKNAPSFQACDGHDAPGNHDDGMASELATWLHITRSPGSTSLLHDSGVEACDEALAAPQLQPSQVMRRANLLRARGIHRINAGDSAGALADLDAADQAIAPANGPLFQRSFCVGTRLLRAYAFSQLPPRAAEARAEAQAAIAARPYDPAVAFAAAMIDVAVDQDWQAFDRQGRAAARFDPTRLGMLYLAAFMRSRFDEMIELHPSLRFDVAVGRGGFVVQNAYAREQRNFLARAETDGAFAYALAATGQAERARQALNDARQHQLTPVAGAEVPSAPPALPTGVEPILARWGAMVDARLQVASGTAGTALDALLQAHPQPDPALLDLLVAIHRALPNDARVTDPLIAALRTIIDRQTRRIADLALNDLVDALPEPEFTSSYPHYDGGSDGRILSNGGYMSRTGPVPGSQTVKFASNSATRAVVGELALLRAAEMARDQHLHGFIELGRRCINRTRELVSYGRVVNQFSAGHECEIDVIFADPAALPEGYRDAAWRLVDADAVWNALAPLYAPQRVH